MRILGTAGRTAERHAVTPERDLPRRRVCRGWGSFLALAAAVLLAACGGSDPPLGSIPRPVVTLRIGDVWDDVMRNSSMKVGPLPERAGTTIYTPHTFVYRDARHPMRFEDVWRLKVSMAADEMRLPVRALDLHPYPGAAGIEETWRRLAEVVKLVNATGWLPNQEIESRYPPAASAAELRKVYASVPAGTSVLERAWTDDQDHEALIFLNRPVERRWLATDDDPQFELVLRIQAAPYPRVRPRAR